MTEKFIPLIRAKCLADNIILPNNSDKSLRDYHHFLAQYGLPDGVQAVAVFQVFEDLRHVRKWTQLRVHTRCSTVYITGEAPALFDAVHVHRRQVGRDTEGNASSNIATQVVVPLTVDQNLSAKKLKSLCNVCVDPDSARKTRCITIAVVDDDSTTAYYRVFSDFHEITHEQWKVKRRRQDERTFGTAECTVFNEDDDQFKLKSDQNVSSNAADDDGDDDDDGTESD